MKKILALSCLFAAFHLQAQPLRIATDVSYPPFSKQNPDGSIVGFDADIARALCDKMKAECELSAHDFDGIIPGLQAKKYELAIASMNISPDRAKVVSFSDMYFNIPGRLIAKEGTPVSGDWFKGKRIGVLRGAIQMKESSEKWGRNGAQIKGYGKITDAFLDLKGGRLDYVYVDATIGEADFLKTPFGKGFAFVGPVFNDPKYYMGSGIAIQKGNKELLAKVNAALKAILADGTYRSIERRYFSYDIYPHKH
ncbi:ABC transporter substrate-binding protein [Vogesella sp. EB]|uniref:transporter substrate-binding domain-containing protein n=1 Tax=Vogesella TaxID=57739 RepID=UPI00064D2CE1|nr:MULTISPECIES: transporter substrate-binding domain-containing protein [Vogesella]KMJ52429.1 ABC transporter substrate-binding protein [Vogesella sp. EB]MDC7698983.1 transporter substrate-binding domain-containing protein [Vogesella indigofera]MDC7708078.1 transporter substrate-binding domain-containing protein [Vogesella indigofera]